MFQAAASRRRSRCCGASAIMALKRFEPRRTRRERHAPVRRRAWPAPDRAGRHRAGWRRSNRSARPARASNQLPKCHRMRANSSRGHFARQSSRASGERSTARDAARAAARGDAPRRWRRCRCPDPERCNAHPRISAATPARPAVSVSGRGTSTAGVTVERQRPKLAHGRSDRRPALRRAPRNQILIGVRRVPRHDVLSVRAISAGREKPMTLPSNNSASRRGDSLWRSALRAPRSATDLVAMVASW